jgi:DNA-binding IclR family transcriptional regulator
MRETLALDGRAANSAVIRALKLLAHIARSQEPVALAALSRALGLPKPTAHRLVRKLESIGFVQRDPLTRRYLVASLFEDVSLSALRHGAGQSARRRVMDRLAQRLGARINLVVLRSGNLFFVEWVESTTPLRVDIGPANSMPVHCTASGKLLLAFAPLAVREGVLSSAPFPARTKNTLTGARALARELAEIRRRGYSEDHEELLPGVNCLAVPVFNAQGEVVAGLAAMAPTASLPLKKLRTFLPNLREAALSLSQELGGGALAATPRRRRGAVKSGSIAPQGGERSQANGARRRAAAHKRAKPSARSRARKSAARFR